MDRASRVQLVATGRRDVLGVRSGREVALYRRDPDALTPSHLTTLESYRAAREERSDRHRCSWVRPGEEDGLSGRARDDWPDDLLAAPRGQFELMLEVDEPEAAWAELSSVLEWLAPQLTACRTLELSLPSHAGPRYVRSLLGAALPWARARGLEDALFWHVPVSEASEVEAYGSFVPDTTVFVSQADGDGPVTPRTLGLSAAIADLGFSGRVVLHTDLERPDDLARVVEAVVAEDRQTRFSLAVPRRVARAGRDVEADLRAVSEALGAWVSLVDPFATALVDATLPIPHARVVAHWPTGWRLRAGETLDVPSRRTGWERIAGDRFPGPFQAQGGVHGAAAGGPSDPPCQGCLWRAYCDGHADSFPSLRERGFTPYPPALVCAVRRVAAELVIEYAQALRQERQHDSRHVARFVEGEFSIHVEGEAQ